MIKKNSMVSLKKHIVSDSESFVYCINQGNISYNKIYSVTRRYATYINNRKSYLICIIGDKGYEVRLPLIWFYDIESYRDRKINAILK